MASGKRASMREGPLAALFRKTDEGEPGAGERGGGRPGARDAARRASSRSRRRTRRRPATRTRRSAPPTRSEPEEPRIPTPQERLRHAFSSEIPENILDAPRGPVRAAPHDVYARPGYHEESGPWARRARGPARASASSASAAPASTRSTAWSRREVEGVEFLAINTDLQSLQQSTADITLHIGAALTRGLGVGLEPRPRPPGGDGGVRQDQGAAQGLATWCSSPPAPVAAPARARRRSSRASPASSAR